MADITPLKERRRRLRSLDEFEPPWWKGLVPWQREQPRIEPIWIVVAGLLLGVLLGLVLFLP